MLWKGDAVQNMSHAANQNWLFTVPDAPTYLQGSEQESARAALRPSNSTVNSSMRIRREREKV